MSDTTHPDPTRVSGAPHPRETPRLIGQSSAQNDFLTAYATGRMHHGWLITGPRGTGKATLAWSIARFLLATPQDDGDALFGAPPPPTTLDISPDHPVARRILAGSEPGVHTVHRTPNDRDVMRNVIAVDDIRAMSRFFQLSATEGGRRVVIIDSADEMNPNAANALLKMLEEPPARTFLLLICHQPSRLLPTIRSRCRELRLGTLGADDLQAALTQAGVETPANAAALAELSGGSVGEAMRLIAMNGTDVYAQVIALLDTLPRLDRPRALKLAEAAAARAAADQFDLLLGLIDVALARLARTGATGIPPEHQAAPNEASVLTRLSPDARAARAWAETAQIISTRSRQGRAVNLDPAALVLDTVFKIQQTAAG